jgi:hypothetical protein
MCPYVSKLYINWKEYINKCKPNDCSFNSPAPYFLLDELKDQLAVSELPNELLELYSETNGVGENVDGSQIGELIWSVDRVIKTNKEFRSHLEFKKLYMSVDQLFFISDGGNGDLFWIRYH